MRFWRLSMGLRVPFVSSAPACQSRLSRRRFHSTALGEGAGASLGNARTPRSRFLENVQLITSASRTISVAGADYAHIVTNGGIAIPLGPN